MLYTLPQAGPAPVIALIEQAHGQLDINVYYISDRRVIRAIRGTVARGVPVFILVDGHPYGMSSRSVRRELKRLEETGAHVEIAPPCFGADEGFDHAKYAVTSGVALIGTANWSKTSFHRDRDYLYTTSNAADIASLKDIFWMDWRHKLVSATAWSKATNLVISPGSQGQMLKLVTQAGPVEIETEELGDEPQLMAALAHKGGQVELLLPASQSGADEQRADELMKHGVQVRYMPVRPLYMHAKMIVGQGLAFIGSENFTDTSLEHNREVGIIFKDNATLSMLHQQFIADWQDAQP